MLDTLKDQQKFRTDVEATLFRNEFETFVFRPRRRRGGA